MTADPEAEANSNGDVRQAPLQDAPAGAPGLAYYGRRRALTVTATPLRSVLRSRRSGSR
jgi:hypothetical protein